MVTVILFVGIGYFLFFYNPMRLIDRRTLTAAVNNGLMKECASLLGRPDTGSYCPAREELPPAIKSLRPRKVIVHPPHTVTIVMWEWRTSDGSTNQWPNVWHDATADDGVYWLNITKPGTINAELRGTDANGNTCSSPIKVRSRNNYNAAPVVLFDGPQDYGEHFEQQADGTALRYHEWFWDISRSYDPETSIASIEWGIYGGGDLDSDGIPDTLYAGITTDGVPFSKLLGLWLSKKGYDYYKTMARVTPELKDDTLRMTVTATDTAAKEKRWGDGHVTLMK